MTGRSRVSRLIDRLYVEIQTALWASLAAFVIYFGVVVAPRIPEQTARVENEQILAASDENHRYCTKWGKREGTREHDACVLDLQQLRGAIARRQVEAMPF